MRAIGALPQSCHRPAYSMTPFASASVIGRMTTERLRGFEVGTSQFRRLLNRQVASLLALEDTTESAWVGRATHPRWPTSRRWSCSPITALATAPNPRRHNIDDACRAALIAKSASDAVNAKSAAGEIVELPSPAPDLWKNVSSREGPMNDPQDCWKRLRD